MKKLGKYSFGIGDRFGRQGKAQLRAIINAKEEGVDITPVWNKSHREHEIIGTNPADVRTEANDAVKALGWTGNYCVDADHISMGNVEMFIESSDFFTLDVADFIGRCAGQDEIDAFVAKYKKYVGKLAIEGIEESFDITEQLLTEIAEKFLLAVTQAAQIYGHIVEKKGSDDFVTEVSMDETDQPQSPVELLFILAAIADAGIPVQTIAPKFSGRFNKGVDYVGNVEDFAKEFEQDIAVISFAVKEFELPDNLKLSIHSGSDKFAIYPSINKALKKFDAGLHVKTAGTTWLEELIGLACAGGDGLDIAKKIYSEALTHFGQLCAPYATVIDIDSSNLPQPEVIAAWGSDDFAKALRHDKSCNEYNSDLRQLMHVGYKIAAKMKGNYFDALEKHEKIISWNVRKNIFDRHIKPIFID